MIILISVIFIKKVSYMGIFGNVNFVVLRIIRNIVLGVMKDDINRNEW